MSASVGGSAVEVFCNRQAILAEGPFYDGITNELIWVDILNNTVNFTNVDSKHTRYGWPIAPSCDNGSNEILVLRAHRSISLPENVGSAIPMEGSASQMVALVGRKVCIVDRQTG